MTEKELVLIALKYFTSNDNEEDIVSNIFTNYQDLGGKTILESLLLKHTQFFSEDVPTRSGAFYSFQINPEIYSDVVLKGALKYLENYITDIDKRNKKAEREDKKADIDLKNAERVYDTYNTTRIFAWIGGISGIILLLLKLAEVLKIWPYAR